MSNMDTVAALFEARDTQIKAREVLTNGPHFDLVKLGAPNESVVTFSSQSRLHKEFLAVLDKMIKDLEELIKEEMKQIVKGSK